MTQRSARGARPRRSARPARDRRTRPSGILGALSEACFLRMMTGQAGARVLLSPDETRIDGSRIGRVRWFGMIEQAPGTFPLATR